MSKSLWRLSHFWLAVVTSIFLIIASVTGAILSFEPVYEGYKGYDISGTDELSLGQLINTIKSNHEDVLSVVRDRNGFIQLHTLEENLPFYINPITGDKIGDSFKTPAIFDFSRTLHRSLFIGQAGRFLIGLASVLLLFITISGFLLILKKQGGIKGYFKTVIKNEFNKDYHTRLGRVLIFSIIVISLTGSYLFMERFGLVPEFLAEHEINEELLVDIPQKPFEDFAFFNETKVGSLRELNFPFSDFPEDYYEVKLKEQELIVNQFNGDIISQIDYPLIKLISQLSFKLHTGEGNIIWSIALGITSLGMLFFIYSGFAIYLKRDKSKVSNPFTSDDATHVVLVGSEEGNTFRFANAFHQQLLKGGIKSYIGEMNGLADYTAMDKLMVFTSTYGVGEAPTNANGFLSKLESFKARKTFDYAVVGFGSTSYPDFCQFGIEVDESLSKLGQAKEMLPLHKISNQSISAFSSWTSDFTKLTGTPVDIKEADLTPKHKNGIRLQVTKSRFSPNSDDATFMLSLKARKRKLAPYRSGDLLAVVAEKGAKERIYSMSVDAESSTIHLSIRRHEFGLCSGYLADLHEGQAITAYPRSNAKFHLPKEAPGVIMIANGTGIAPFLGMIQEANSNQNLSLFWGGQNRQSLELYTPVLKTKEHKLEKLVIAFSRESEPKQYVQDALAKEALWLIESMEKGYTIMICGGLSMQQEVEKLLEQILQSTSDLSLKQLKEIKRLLTDCY